MRDRLVSMALEWEAAYCNAPAITSTLSEYDAGMLIGMSDEQYREAIKGTTAVQRGHDFIHEGVRYQVKANRPSGKPGSFVTLVSKASNYHWDQLIWVLYDRFYVIQEAWIWGVEEYREAFDDVKRLSPKHYRQGRRLV